jgi:hypothetical protein
MEVLASQQRFAAAIASGVCKIFRQGDPGCGNGDGAAAALVRSM